MSGNLAAALGTFRDPPLEFGPIPFWFWNDDLDETELLRQLRAFAAAGCGGVVPHARVGLARRLEYMGDEFLRLMRVVVEEAARLGMKVILYDEASYPSGSAKGAVVATDPRYASQAIGLWELEVEGPLTRFWRPNTGRALLDGHVCTCLGQVDPRGAIRGETVQVLPPLPNDIFRIEVPQPGRWKAMSVWNTASGGHIRGAYPEEESGHATAPAAGDILNPDAIACFLRLTHERYFQALGDHFGSTIIALFTDEPSVFGKGAQRPREARPYTPGFAAWLACRWGRDPRPWLPALWLDYGPGTTEFRRQYEQAVQDRLHQTFYAAQSQWCQSHGIALTGHPSGSNEMSCLRYFQIPGQDMVWRWVLPGSESARRGAHSVAPKAATSAARLTGARRVLTEACGAYGWQLTLDEVKWLLDWHLVRGNNLVNLHAFFYSIRGRRAWESEPDLGVHHVWWPHFPHLANYARRLSWLLTDGDHICSVAVVGDGNALPWAAAAILQERQVDYLYLDDEALAGAGVEPARGQLRVGAQSYGAVIVDGAPALGRAARRTLEAFRAAGGLVVEGADPQAAADAVAAAVPADLSIRPAHPDLRYIHYRKLGLDLYFVVNEGEAPLDGQLGLAAVGQLQAWDPLSGAPLPLTWRRAAAGTSVDLVLERRQGLVLAVDPAQPARPGCPPRRREVERPLPGPWSVRAPEGSPVPPQGLGDWARHPGLELFTGTVAYATTIEVSAGVRTAALDLGEVGELAECLVDGRRAGVALWAPYRVELGCLSPGRHQVEVRVTNSMANAYEGAQRLSGLLGPVRLIERQTTP
ncbi:MAG: glycosylhydrolase-like jelly roll fold domain-containing protein [Gemmatimonadota bacterium]